jgi:hypothetical protein
VLTSTSLQSYTLINPRISSVTGAPLSFSFSQAAGGNFGGGQTVVTPTLLAFDLTANPLAAANTASYSIGRESVVFETGANGFAGDLGTFLSIGGDFAAAGGDDVAASLVTTYTLVGGGGGGTTTPLVLAFNSAGGTATSGDFSVTGAGAQCGVAAAATAFCGFASDSVPVILAAYQVIDVTTTFSVYADPASIDSIAPDLSLTGVGANLPADSISDVEDSFSDEDNGVPIATPEPGAWVLMIAGVGLVGARLRSRAAKTA